MPIIREHLSERPARFFEAISAIPRASRAEAQIADYLVNFASERGLAYYRDAANNVLIKKPATAGREGEPPLLLQAHSDMVTEIAFGHVHDFATKGVELQVAGNMLFANGTTLGADDGFGMALMLSVLDGGAQSHPPLECLFTAAEEIGLIGVGAFDFNRISARRMLNFDSAEEHLIITGCCGGIRSDFSFPITRERGGAVGLQLTLRGFCGGHSGEDIHRGRANALIVMGKILKMLREHVRFRIVSFLGGDKDNAIPRDCVAVILPEDMALALAFLKDTRAILSSLVTSSDDSKCGLTAETVEVTDALTHEDTEKLLTVLSVRNGVFYQRSDGKEPPETSRNLARVRMTQESVSVCFSSRSPYDHRLEECSKELSDLASALGGKARHHSYYPGWEGASDSPVCSLWQKCYREITGKDITTTVIHAGLECGLISSKLPGLDVISLGCNIYDLHTPAERMELDSLERVYRTLLAFLKAC